MFGLESPGGRRIAKRILLVGSFWEYSLESSYRRAFESIAWEVIAFDWEKHYYSSPLARHRIAERIARPALSIETGKRLLNAVQISKPDLIFVVKGRHINPRTLREIKKAFPGISLINFNPDSPWSNANKTPYLLESIASYDVHFTWNKALIDQFKASGSNWTEYLPFAYDPTIHFPVEDLVIQPKPFDAVFIGTYDPVRDELLGELSDFRIGIWGNDWHLSRHVPKSWIQKDAVYGADSARLLDLGYVTLNLLREQNANSHNMRTFEIPATAHAMLTNRSREQLEFFSEGFEIECFADVGELKAKLQMFREKHCAKEYGQRAYLRVKDETYAKRAIAILAAMKL